MHAHIHTGSEHSQDAIDVASLILHCLALIPLPLVSQLGPRLFVSPLAKVRVCACVCVRVCACACVCVCVGGVNVLMSACAYM